MDTNDWTHNATTARINVPARTSRAPGRRARWTAEIGSWRGGWRAEGATEREALTRLTDAFARFITEHREPAIITYAGFVAVISAVPDTDPDSHGTGWREEIVHPDGHRNLCYRTVEDFTAADAAARRTLAHLATDWHNDASVHAGAAFLEGCAGVEYGQYGPDEFYQYAAWQRAAKAALDSDNPECSDCHRWASDNWHSFEVPRPVPAA